MVRTWSRRSATRRRLRDLDARDLDDIGVTECQRRRECARWFWQGGGQYAVAAKPKIFFGWQVVGGAFLLAVFGWGLGFYGPPIYLHAVCHVRGWSVALVSGAVTVHYLAGGIVVANMPFLYRRLGVPTVTKAGAVLIGLGITGWAVAQQPWQLFAATLLSGAGWAAMGAAAVNAIVVPWFVRTRPAALSAAYNGSSIGGVIFSPMWVAAIDKLGFPAAAATIGTVTAVSVWLLADTFFSRTPEQRGLMPDGGGNTEPLAPALAVPSPSLDRGMLWRNPKFLTLAAGMALGLFAQIGLLAHLFSLLVPALGAQNAGLAIGGATAAAIIGRTLVSGMIGRRRDRRLCACASYLVQIGGSTLFLMAGGTSVPLLLIGVVLFGAGIGNATSLPPLIAQSEFSEEDVGRVVPLTIAVAQACYAFAPAVFALARELTPATGAEGFAPYVFSAAALIQGLAIVALLAGRRGPFVTRSGQPPETRWMVP